MVDYCTTQQAMTRVREEFFNLSGVQETITRNQTICLIQKLGSNDHHETLPDLLHDADFDGDAKIDIDNVITIINHISKKDEVNVIYDEPDENQLNTRLRQLHIKVQEILKNGVVINQQTYDQLCQECGVSNNIDLQH